MNHSNHAETARLDAVAQVLRDAVKPPGGAELERGLRALRARERTRPRVALRWAAVAAVACCVALGFTVAPQALRRAGLATAPVALQRIGGGTVLEGGYLSEAGHDGVELVFNEGSRFRLSHGTRGRLREVRSDGARFDLDHGSASFQITPNVARHWAVEAGPFVVSVQGTDFTVAWEPTSERLEVRLRQGRVVVSGPVVGEDFVVRPGQALMVDLPRGKSEISVARPEMNAPDVAAPVVPPVSAPPAALPVPSAKPAAPPSASASRGTERRFRAALANGEWDRILAEVEHDGVDASLRTLSSDDLFALADAARYRRRPDLARAALLAERERFPSSSRSLDTSFLLGRVEELRAGGRPAAIKRYDEYLARAPNGTYAAEALGRKMILVKESQGPASARQIAEEYLRSFPKGSYAKAARALLEQP